VRCSPYYSNWDHGNLASHAYEKSSHDPKLPGPKRSNPAWDLLTGVISAHLRPISRESANEVEQELGSERYALRPQNNRGRGMTDVYRTINSSTVAA
jgi:hypothetical protein